MRESIVRTILYFSSYSIEYPGSYTKQAVLKDMSIMAQVNQWGYTANESVPDSRQFRPPAAGNGAAKPRKGFMECGDKCERRRREQTIA